MPTQRIAELYDERDHKIADDLVAAITTIDHAHHQVHSGNHYEVHIEGGASVTSTISCAFKVPSGTKRVHMVIDWKTSGRAHIELLRGATWTASTGTDMTVSNNNFVTSNTSQLQGNASGTFTSSVVVKDPTALTGTAAHVDYAYAAKQAGGNTSLPRHEWLLNNNENYGIRITSDTGAGVYMGTVPHWYEHIDK